MSLGGPRIEPTGKVKNLEAEIARLQELLRGTGANRYWEGRWRDANAENQRLRAALEDTNAALQHAQYPKVQEALRIIRKALAK